MSRHCEVNYVEGEERPVEVFLVDGHEVIRQGTLIKIARLKDEYAADIGDADALVKTLRESLDADIFTFWDRVPTDRRLPYLCEAQTQALLPVTTYEAWWENLDRRIRKLIRRSAKLGVEVRIVDFNEELVAAIKSIFDETPIRRGKPFWHYNRSLDILQRALAHELANSEFLGAFDGTELIGFMKLIYRDKFADPVLFLSKLEHLDKYPNNVLLAKAVERCAEKRLPFIHYSDWRLGSHGDFLRRNGFIKCDVNRYYVPLTVVGKLALQLRLHKRIWDVLPEQAKIRILKLREQLYRMPFRRKTGAARSAVSTSQVHESAQL
jgi:hypothetical protein